jgi:iron complex outermembrane receptor protein
MKNVKEKLTGIAAIAAMLVCHNTVKAAAAEDQSPPSSTALEEITVTAEKRSENVQNVPIAITAFSENTLRAKGITDLHELTGLIPNVNLDQGSPFSGSNSVLSASIRGIGQDDFAFNLDPGVGVYVDGVYFARTVGANQSLLDVERVEVLKGPQGTLFGRNTIGGAISIVTRTPGDEFAVQAQATVGSFNRRDIAVMAAGRLSAAHSVSLADTVRNRSGRCSAQRGQQRGFRHPGRHRSAGVSGQGAVAPRR